MPNFSAEPPLQELYDPANVIAFRIDGSKVNCIKGTFKEEVVELPSPIANRQGTVVQMFECHTGILDNDPNSPPMSTKIVRVIGRSENITALVVDDLTTS